MPFFDTVAGQRFTEGTLPALVRELEKANTPKKQYVKTYNAVNVKEGIEAELEDGAQVVSMASADNKIVVVFSYT